MILLLLNFNERLALQRPGVNFSRNFGHTQIARKAECTHECHLFKSTKRHEVS